MKEKVVLYRATHIEITNMLAEKVRTVTSNEEKERLSSIYLNWMEFLKSLEGSGLFGLVANNNN